MKQKFDTLLEIHDLSVSFRMYDGKLEQKDLKVISDLHLTVRPGEIVAVAGSSGSGKSLLASAILGITDTCTTKARNSPLSCRQNCAAAKSRWSPSRWPISTR